MKEQAKASVAERAQMAFTVHLDFLAGSEDEAVGRAGQYAEALLALCPEMDSYRARLSAQADWSASTLVFCNAPGPDPMDVCVDEAGHAGGHHGPGASRSWTDGEIVSAPDSPEQLST
jgi:hypothetical protein